MTNHDALLAATEAERQELLSIPFLQDGVAGRLSLEDYIAFLTEAYHHVKHTLPLLMACGGRIPERLEWLRVAMAEYVEEETGHQEWILDDIKACGADAEAVRKGTASLPVEVMVAYAYDVIARKNPAGFLGMVLVLEGTSVKAATQAASALQAKFGLPPAAFTYLNSHGTLDISHTAFFATLVDQLTEAEDLAAVTHCAKVFYKLYGDIFRGLDQRRAVTSRGAA